MHEKFARGAAVLLLSVIVAACGGAEGRKARYLEKGEEYFAQRNFEKARVEFRNALQIDPNDAGVRYQVGRVAEKLNNPREAVGHYQAAIDLDPKQMPARAALGRLYLLGGLPDKAMELAEPGLTQEPQNAQLLTVRSAAKAQLGNVTGAFEDAEVAIKLAPADEYTVALLASLYRKNARSDKAIEVVRAGLEQLPASIDLRIVLADLELGQQHPGEAETQLKKVIELQPHELSHRYRLARFYMLTKNPQGAERALRDAVAASPDDVEAKIGLVELLATNQGAAKAEAQMQAFAAQEPNAAPVQLALARFYEAHGKADEAKKVYRKVIEAQDTKPDGLTARNRLAAVLIQQQKTDEALGLIDQVLKENARDNDALVLRGNLALARGDAPAAIADLRAVLRDQPNSVPVTRALARAHLRNNELALAEETLHSAVQANPVDRDLRSDLAQLLAQSGRAEQARPMLEQLANESPGDISTLETLLRVQAALKDLKAARATAADISRMHPDLPLGPFLEGTIDEAEQKLDAATASYERALAIQPSAAEPLTALVRIAVARKQSDQALVRLDRTIAQQPDNVVAHNLKGELLISRNEIEPAIVAFDEAIRRAPKWWMPYRGSALAQLAAKRPDAAIAVLERGIQQTGAASLSTELASLYERANRPDDAIRTYEAMVSREPSVAAMNNLAMLLVSYRSDQGSLDRAQQLTAKLAHVADPSILNTRGWVKFKRGEYLESLPLLQEAVDKAPQSPLMRYHLGMAQLRTGNRAAARANLEAAVAAGHSFPGVNEAQAALAEIKRAG